MRKGKSDIRRLAVCKAVAAVFSAASGAWAVQLSTTWTGPDGGSWISPANWSGGVVPDNAINTFDVRIEGTAASKTAMLTTSAIIDSLTVDAGDGLNLVNGSSLRLVGSGITSAGSIALSSTGTTTELVFTDITLSGGGTIVMGNSASNNVRGFLASNRLTNQSNTIRGAGVMGGLALTNQGTIIADQTNRLSIVLTGLSNFNSGMIRADGGTAILQGIALNLLNNSGGTLHAADNSILRIVDLTVSGGTLSTTGSGRIQTHLTAGTLNNVTNGGHYVGRNGTTTYITGTLSSSGTIEIENGAVLQNSGNPTINGGTFIINGIWEGQGGSVTVGSVAGTGMYKQIGGSASVQHLRTRLAAIDGTTVTVRPDGGPDGVSRLSELPILPNGAKLDLTNNDLILDYSDAQPIPTSAVRTILRQSYAGGAWNGPGIISSSAAASPAGARTGLGYAASSSIFGPGGGTFSGQVVDGSTLLIKYTFAGDADLDGDVDSADLGLLATNWQASSTDWFGGDFDYNGRVNLLDLILLATNWQSGVGAPLAQALDQAGLPPVSLPEPASLGLLLIPLLSRRRRMHR